MSKIGRLPITIPEGVTLSLVASQVKVVGPKGELSYLVQPKISVKLEGNQAMVTRSSDDKPIRALHGLTRSLIANMVTGVSVGFTKTLELQGTGYRARLSGNNLILSLGFSHEIEYLPPIGVTLKVENTTTIIISGFDRQQVGEAAAKIRSFKKPEPYKGKGIRYQGEIVRRKAGKAAKAATTA
ncbi:MAG: 50S ribosomal protein L6 [bacterium]